LKLEKKKKKRKERKLEKLEKKKLEFPFLETFLLPDF